MVSFQPTVDLLASAEITLLNMQPYYEHYSVDWELSQVHQQIVGLENWDILYEGSVIGAIRLAYDSEGCNLRDLQVVAQYQNRGIGAAAIAEAERLASKAGSVKLRLRVFKISPAYCLYKRVGFTVDSEEDSFYYMSKHRSGHPIV